MPTFVSLFPDEKAWAIDTLAIVHTLVGNVGIRLPNASNPEGLKQDLGAGGGNDPSGSMVAHKIVDTRADRTQSRTTMDPASPGETPGPATVIHIP